MDFVYETPFDKNTDQLWWKESFYRLLQLNLVKIHLLHLYAAALHCVWTYRKSRNKREDIVVRYFCWYNSIRGYRNKWRINIETALLYRHVVTTSCSLSINEKGFTCLIERVLIEHDVWQPNIRGLFVMFVFKKQECILKEKSNEAVWRDRFYVWTSRTVYLVTTK